MRFSKYMNEGVYDPSIFKAIFLAGGPGCFSSDTLIGTNEGYKQIKDVEQGDIVKTLNNDNEIVESPVTELLKNTIHGMIEIEFEDGTFTRCSVDHEGRLKDGSWKEAANLLETDELGIGE